MEAVRLRKENQIYSADEKWVNVPVDCSLSIASGGVFLDSSHSLPCNFFFYFLLTGEHWLCLTMKNDPREKTKSCQTSGRWFIRKSTKRNSCFSSYLSFLRFQLLFPVLLDDGQAYQILAHKLQKRKRDKILPIDSQSNAFASFRITAFFFCGPGCSGRQCYSLN